jgi:membrane-bound lytic murein transglycosylase D
MNPWCAGFFLLCGLLIGCGGGSGNLAKVEAPPPAAIVQEPVDLGGEQEDSLTEQLSAQRLEELYAKSGIPGWDPAVEEELKKGDQRLKIDVPIHVNKQVKAYLVYFSTERKSVIRKYLARSTRYLPMIREIFQEHGLPEDLAYLAMIESGFNPHAYSHASACGMWQFIRGTGLRYNLAINDYVDERRDPEKATHAAAKYLLDLYKQFGSWYLAAASYNCGENRVQREINNSNHKNFWELSANQCLPGETKNYVPQMIAATLIAKNPEKFGFKGVPYLPPIQYDKVKVDDTTSLTAAAVACNVPSEEMQVLNPELRRGITPPGAGSYTLKIPKGSTDSFSRNIMVARVEHPAVIKSYKRVAKKSYRRSSSRKYASHKAKARSSRSKSKTAVARSHNTKSVNTASVRKGKSTQRGGSTTVLASMVGSSKSSKSGAKSVSKNKSSSKTAARKSSSKKSKKKISSSRSKTKSVRLASHGKSKSSKSSKRVASNRKTNSSSKKSNTILMSKAR